MDHWKGLSTVFDCWNFCFTIITQWWAMVDFITQNGPIFHKIFKIFVVLNQKLCDVYGQKLVWVVSTTYRYYKHSKFCQNPRGDPKFLTWNDPYAVTPVKFLNRTRAGNTLLCWLCWLCWLLFHYFAIGCYKWGNHLSGIAHVFSIAMFWAAWQTEQPNNNTFNCKMSLKVL